MASIGRLPSGKYRVRWRDLSGRQTSSGAVGSKLEAAALARRVEADLRRQRSLDATVQAGRLMDLAAVVDRYCSAGLATERMGEGRAWEVRTTLERLIEETGWTTSAAANADAIDRWRVKAKKSGRGDNPIRYLLAVLRWASGAPLRQPVDPGVFVLPRMPSPRRAPPALLTDAQVAAAVDAARAAGGLAAASAIEHLATYGCRPVEVCRLLVSDLDVAAGTLTHRTTKNGDAVTHPLFPRHRAIYSEIASGRPPDAPLFCSPSGEAWWLGDRGQAAQLTGWYRDHCTAGLPSAQAGIYCLKDYAISRMELAGIDDRTKALFTGHRTLGVFARYKATNHDRARDALAKLCPLGRDTV